ncbi:MAG: hypothetical protein ACLFTT_14610 [Candidatus Hydrogenedentota bacterium]
MLCFRCWSAGLRQCRAHATAAVLPEAPADNASTASPRDTHIPEDNQPGEMRRVTWAGRRERRCVRCGEELGYTAARHRGTPRYCTSCQEELVKPPDTLPMGAVDAATACYLEQVFLDRVDPRGKAKAAPGADNVDARVFDTHPCAGALRKRLDTLPANRAVDVRRAQGIWRWLGGHDRRVTFAACADRRQLLERGYQHGPAGAALLHQARTKLNDEHSGVLVLFSPAGWQQGLALAPDTVLVCLGKDGRWQVRHALASADDAAYIEGLFTGYTAQEETAHALARIREAPAGGFPLSAKAFARQHGYTEDAVAAAFRAAADEGAWHLCDDTQRQDLLLDLR